MPQATTETYATGNNGREKPKKLMGLAKDLDENYGSEMAIKDLCRMISNLKRQRTEEDIRQAVPIVAKLVEEADKL